MRPSLSPWPVLIVVLIWGAVAWVGTRGEASWMLLGVGGVVGTALIALVEIGRLVTANQRFRRNSTSNDGGAYGLWGADAGQGHAGPSSGGHVHGGDGGGGSDGGGGDGGGGGGGD